MARNPFLLILLVLRGELYQNRDDCQPKTFIPELQIVFQYAILVASERE